MKYRLPRQIIPEEFKKLITRELRKQHIHLERLTRQDFKDLVKVMKEIEEQGLPSYLVCSKLPGALGRGLFLHPEAEPLPKGRLIAPYAGLVSIVPPHRPEGGVYAFVPLDKMHLTEAEQTLVDKRSRYNKERLYAVKIDAAKAGNFTRFVNHSAKPNLEAQLFTVGKNSFGLETAPVEVFYHTKKIIRPGEQLLVSYEGEENCYWGPAEKAPELVLPRTFRLNAALKVVT